MGGPVGENSELVKIPTARPDLETEMLAVRLVRLRFSCRPRAARYGIFHKLSARRALQIAGDLQAKAGHAGDFAWAGHQFHLADPQGAQDLGADAEQARVPLG